MDLLACGPQYILLQNVVYALPVVKGTLFTDTATPTLQVSNTAAFTNNVPMVLANGASTVSGGFIRSTAGPCLVEISRD